MRFFKFGGKRKHTVDNMNLKKLWRFQHNCPRLRMWMWMFECLSTADAPFWKHLLSQTQVPKEAVRLPPVGVCVALWHSHFVGVCVAVHLNIRLSQSDDLESPRKTKPTRFWKGHRRQEKGKCVDLVSFLVRYTLCSFLFAVHIVVLFDIITAYPGSKKQEISQEPSSIINFQCVWWRNNMTEVKRLPSLHPIWSSVFSEFETSFQVAYLFHYCVFRSTQSFLL